MASRHPLMGETAPVRLCPARQLLKAKIPPLGPEFGERERERSSPELLSMLRPQLHLERRSRCRSPQQWGWRQAGGRQAGGQAGGRWGNPLRLSPRSVCAALFLAGWVKGSEVATVAAGWVAYCGGFHVLSSRDREGCRHPLLACDCVAHRGKWRWVRVVGSTGGGDQALLFPFRGERGSGGSGWLMCSLHVTASKACPTDTHFRQPQR